MRYKPGTGADTAELPDTWRYTVRACLPPHTSHTFRYNDVHTAALLYRAPDRAACSGHSTCRRTRGDLLEDSSAGSSEYTSCASPHPADCRRSRVHVLRHHTDVCSPTLQTRHPFNGHFSRTTWVSQQHKG